MHDIIFSQTNAKAAGKPACCSGPLQSAISATNRPVQVQDAKVPELVPLLERPLPSPKFRRHPSSLLHVHLIGDCRLPQSPPYNNLSNSAFAQDSLTSFASLAADSIAVELLRNRIIPLLALSLALFLITDPLRPSLIPLS